MPQLADPDSSDFEKLAKAFSTITGSFSSFDDLLAAFGLSDLPSAQRYGIMFGCLTFVCTVAAVITLLVMGGTFKRIAEQSQTGSATVPSAIESRAGRPLLYENLLEARHRMLTENYPQLEPSERVTNLTKMLMNDVPQEVNVADLVDEDGKKREKARRIMPPGFVENYLTAYRTCQDKPGGTTLSGLPEARFEAYARSYAGCGVHTTTAYRRSYARLYERMACNTHASETKYSEHYQSRPQDLVGRTVRLEPLDVQRHLQVLFNISCGEAFQDNKAFDPNEIWGFLDCGPFENPEEMRQSVVFQRQVNEAAFAIVEMLTDRVIGVVMLTNDDPKNLNISLEVPIVKPTSEGTVEEIEACFLLLDRLFALGYRRVQIALDVHDVTKKKLPGRLGFTQEGMIPKHMIVKDASRDSNIYGMLNSDWDKGARAFLFKKLHGAKAQTFDEWNNKKEGEIEEQVNVLKERKEMEEAEAAAAAAEKKKL